MKSQKCVYRLCSVTKNKRMITRAIEKCMKERSWKVEHDNARSERTRKGWVGREWTTIHLADLSLDQCLHFWVISYHSNTAKLHHSVTFFWTGLFCLLFLTGKKVNAARKGQKIKWGANVFVNYVLKLVHRNQQTWIF